MNSNLILPIFGELHIEFEFAMRAFQKYLSDIEILKSGSGSILQKQYAQSYDASKMKIASKTIGGQNVATWELNKEEFLKPNSIALHSLNGVMQFSGGACSQGVQDLIANIQTAEENNKIIGHVLQAYTGGGESFAGQELHAAIQEAKKPFITHANFLASAGIMGTLASDEIIANSKNSQFGSVGTYISLNKKVMDTIKNDYIDIYAKDSTEKNKAFNLAIQGDYSKLQELVDNTNKSFIAEVVKFRNVQDTKGALNGAMFNAADAKKLGFIDSIGSLQYAFNRVANYQNYGKRKRM